MNKPFNHTLMMMRTLFKRDWIKYLIWVIALLAYAASGAGKFELAMNSKATAAPCIVCLRIRHWLRSLVLQP
ncbi:hypothetical protein [Lactococcus fujiensis]|uniref:hypothetical protein n=1 Tax=Lactococcus fujiensis TaxID=610251 RepID=UPI0020932D2A|nr:hypothetical protein [Lactococcus fujiensis]